MLGKITRNAKGYIKIDKKKGKLYLYDKAELYYQDTELKAGIIILDYNKNEVSAGRIKDSTGALTQPPFFKQAGDEVNPDSIRFNFDTKKALIWNSRSEQSGMNVTAFTGSAGKTSTRYITSTILKKYGETHYSQGNNNNLIGVCLTLSRLPATKKYCVLELGMNHIGEIEELTKIALPNIALITNVSNSHIANFKSEKEIAEAITFIFLGLKDKPQS